MEIKILCQCGTKFKFDAEPVNGRMPGPVDCPTCGADATPQANAIIESAPADAPAQTLAASPVGLRINRPPALPQESSTVAAGGTAPFRAVPHRLATHRTGADTKSPVMKVVTSILVVGIALFGAWQFGAKWYKRANLVAQMASALGAASTDGEESSGGSKNLWYEKCAMLFIQHSNHLEVAEACQDYWKTNLHKESPTVINLAPKDLKNLANWTRTNSPRGLV